MEETQRGTEEGNQGGTTADTEMVKVKATMTAVTEEVRGRS